MQRFPYFDFIRCIAIFLVLGRHIPLGWVHEGLPQFENFFIGWRTGGWCGVDLFFVLSGFLVSGLLFDELKKNDHVNLKRFYIRRSFKIIPAFLVFWFFGGIIEYSVNIPEWSKFTFAGWFKDLTFIQNYIGGHWPHLWSLAVEEHFYLLISIIILFVQKDIKKFLGIAIALILYSVAFRLYLYTKGDPVFFWTHTRMDSLLFGSLLSFLVRFTRVGQIQLSKSLSLAFVVAAILLVIPNFIKSLEKSEYIFTYGLSVNYLASGLIIIAAVLTTHSTDSWLKPFNIVGKHSYSIYLWHIPILHLFLDRVTILNRPSLTNFLEFVAFFASSILVGIAISKLVEGPILKFRDRIFP